MSKSDNSRLDPAIEYQQLLSIFDSIDEPIYVSDPNTYEVLYANQALKKIFGDVVGQKCYLSFQNMESPCSFCTNDRIFGENTGKAYIWEFQNKINKRWYRCIDKAIRWPDGRMVRYEMAVDITEYKKTEKKLLEQEEELRLAFENAKDAIFWADANTGMIIKCNKAAEILLEKDKDEIIGQKQTILHPLEKMEYYSTMFRRHIEEKSAIDDDAEIITKSGKIKPVNITASITSVGERQIIQGIFRDITERKKIEDELKRKVKELEEFHEMAIERELKMVELKEEIERLKEELGKLKDLGI